MKLVTLLSVLAVLVLVGFAVAWVVPRGDRVEVYTHCGLDYIQFEYQGRQWEFADADPNDGNPPPGWPNGDAAIHIVRVEGDTAVARGPDGKLWDLAVVEPGQTPQAGCL